MLERFIFWLLDLPWYYPEAAAIVFVTFAACLAAFVLWPLPPVDNNKE